MKINKDGHLIIKKTCPHCGHGKAMMKRNSKDIVCNKCKRIIGVVKDESI